MTGAELRTRIEREYERHTAVGTTHGALSWFGRIVRRTPRAVWQWCQMDPVPDGGHLMLLALVEKAPKGTKWVANPESLIR